MSLITLDQIAREVCVEIEDPTLKLYDRVISYLVRGFSQLNIYVIPNIKTFILPISDNLSIRLPDEYIYYTKIGVMTDGYLITLGINDGLMMPGTALGYSTANQYAAQARTTNELSSSHEPLIDGYTYYNCWRGNNNIGEVFGAIGGLNDMGYYREDKANNMLQLGGLTFLKETSECYVECKCDITSEGIQYVPIECQEALISFALGRFFAKADKGRADREDKRYQMEYNKLKNMYTTETKQEYLDRFLRTTKSTVKR